MYSNAGTPMSRSIGRGLVLLPVLVVALSLASAGAASAQSGFQATVKGIEPKPGPPCPNGAIICGNAVTNYGDATWTVNLIAFAPYSPTCDSYEVADTFLLGDGSTLVLDETGLACGPGKSFSAPGGDNSYGNPGSQTGSWTVQSATGQFASFTGTGTDTLQFAGAHVSGAFSGAS